jgi:hypothetical protein
MIIAGLAAGVRILLEKGPSRDHILKIKGPCLMIALSRISSSPKT